MDPERALMIKKNAFELARRYGLSVQDGEDFSQHAIVIYLQSPERKASLFHLLVDYLRVSHGKITTKSHTQKFNLDRAFSRPSYDVLKKYCPNMEDLFFYESCRNKLSEQWSENMTKIFDLYFSEGWTQTEISKHLDTTPSNVCQAIRRIARLCKKIHDGKSRLTGLNSSMNSRATEKEIV